VKELKAKIVNLEYDKQEKEEKIVELTTSLQHLKTGTVRNLCSVLIASPTHLIELM
jgi:hypothetical protein